MSTDKQKLKKLLDLMEDPTGTLLTDIEALESKIDRTDENVSSLASRYSVTEDEIKALFQALDSGSLKGEQGIAGNDGKDGRNGIDGINGKDGLDGKNGLQGASGKDGLDGEKGEPGEYEDI